MTGKLIKYEMRSTFRFLLLLWGALIAMSLLMCMIIRVSGIGSAGNNVFSVVSNSFLAQLLTIVSWVLYIALFSALVILTIAIVIKRFYQGLLGEEGYLMHTLPVKVWQLITSKGVVATCAVFGSSLIALLSILLISCGGFDASLINGLKALGQTIHQDPRVILIMVEMLVLFILGIVKSIYQIYAAIAIGQLQDRHRVLMSIAAYIGISVALSIIASILMFTAGRTGLLEGIDDFFLIGPSGILEFATSQITALILFIITALQLVLFHVIAEQLLSKRLNLL